ncbi:hypothetical protein [Xenorhabdus sp. TS4]|uniref:hypothetical protein n=1 Tax=Xenorhabdus sp. TS4 TaxID=1873483 RepID=UPI001656AB97|nr:hypothetical protein [Xenorhabdus sp. TS4]MBC8951282.1 hypothetical protein [Xenorhabdus sp. TS4]
MLDFVLLVVVGLGISIVLVRRSSRKAMDLELTWLQSLKIVLLRGAVAMGLGFGIGRLALWGMQYGLLSESVLREHALIAVAVVLLCGLGSFFAFQWIAGRISGRSTRAPLLIKTVMYESGYFVLLMPTLLVRLVLSDLAYETFFKRNNGDYFLFIDHKDKYKDL